MSMTRFPRVDHAMRMVRTYLVECTENKAWNDRRTAELNEAIRSCVERIAVDRREARQPVDALRHAIGYVDELLEAADRTSTEGRPFADGFALARN
jgi:hypothetical protein